MDENALLNMDYAAAKINRRGQLDSAMMPPLGNTTVDWSRLRQASWAYCNFYSTDCNASRFMPGS
jgi:hypothetical protein